MVLYDGDMVAIMDGRFLLFPVFSRGWAFFTPFLTHPGGVAQWAGAGISQFLAYPYIGALIYTAVAGAVCLATSRLIARMGGNAYGSLVLVPVLPMLVIWNYYTFPLADHIGLICVLVACAHYVRFGDMRARAVVFAAGLIALYFVVGAPAILFAAVCGLYELTRPDRNKPLGAIYLAAGGVVPYIIGVRLLGAGPAEAFLGLLGTSGHVRDSEVGSLPIMVVLAWAGLYAFYAAVPLASAFGKKVRGLIGRFLPPRSASADNARRGAPGGFNGRVLVLVAGTLLAWTTYQVHAGTLLRIHSCTLRKMWPQVLAHARRLPHSAYTTQAAHCVNRALFETRRLGDEMFSFPQSPMSLLPNPSDTYQSPAAAETLLELGAVNHAEQIAYELLEAWGPRPTVLRLLARTFTVKGQPEAARHFLKVLSRDIVHGRWARQQLDRLAEPEGMQSDEDISRIRSVMFTQNSFEDRALLELLGALCDNNNNNRMSLEYLVAQAMLYRRPDTASRALANGLDCLSYEALPENYAEAIVLYSQRTGNTVDLQGLTIPIRVKDRYASFSRRMEPADPTALAKTLATHYPDSYFRYYVTGQSGRDNE